MKEVRLIGLVDERVDSSTAGATKRATYVAT